MDRQFALVTHAQKEAHAQRIRYEHLPPSEQYDELKKILIRHYGDTAKDRIRKLLRQENFRGMRPSGVWIKMRELATDDLVSDQFLRTQLSEQVSGNVKLILSLMDGRPWDETLNKADEAWRNESTKAQDSAELFDVKSREMRPTNTASDELTRKLTATVEALMKDVRELKYQAARSRSRSRSRSRGGSYHQRQHQQQRQQHSQRSQHQQQRTREDSQLCRIHRKFGAAAWSCRQPCSRSVPIIPELVAVCRKRSGKRLIPSLATASE